MIGLFSKRISFYRASETPDGQGGFLSDGVLVYSKWATVRQKNQKQKEQGDQVGNDKEYTIQMDAKGLTIFLTDVIIYQGNRLDILTITTQNERGLQYIISAVERKKV